MKKKSLIVFAGFFMLTVYIGPAAAWYWKPAEASLEKIAMLEDSFDYDGACPAQITFPACNNERDAVELEKALQDAQKLNDYMATVDGEIKRMWDLYRDEKYDEAIAAGMKIFEKIGPAARRINQNMDFYDYPADGDVLKYQVLSRAGEVVFYIGEMYRRQNKLCEAKKYYQIVLKDFSYSQTWDGR